MKCYSCKQNVNPEVFNKQYNYCPKCGLPLFKIEKVKLR